MLEAPTPPVSTAADLELPTVDVAGNRLQLFVESASMTASLTTDIRSARRRAWIESYTVADDAIGQAVAAALKERAAAGVECRLSYDAVGSYATPTRYFDELRAAGVDARPFRPWGRWFHRFSFLRRFNRRNHRKLAVLDDDVAYFGGMNLVDAGGSGVPPAVTGKHPESEAAWRDVHVQLTGPAVVDIAAAFNDLWMRNERKRPPKRANPTLTAITRCTTDAIFFFDARPHVRYHRPGRVFKALINRARTSITLAMAYFLPFGGVLRALLKARKRGVTVQVIVPSVSDVPLVKWASRHGYEKLLRHGIRIYERRDRMLHSKVMIVDGTWSIIGSCNFDPRSLLLNLECFAVIRSAETAKLLANVCRYERRHSDPVRLSGHKRRNCWEQWRDRAAWMLRRWL